MRDLHYDFIRFLAMTVIFVGHFYTTCVEKNIYFPYHLSDEFVYHGVLHFGSISVGVFFMLSGALLWLKFGNDKFSTGRFYKDRFFRMYVSQWIGFLVALALTYILTTDIGRYVTQNKLGCFISFMGFNFDGVIWQRLGINTIYLIGEWFTSVILITYLLFPVLHFLFIKYRWEGTCILGFITILNMKYQILSGGNGYFSFSNGIMYFWVGMLFQEYKVHFSFPYGIKILLFVFILSIAILAPINVLGFNCLPFFIMTVSTFIFLYQFSYTSAFSKFICKYNYEIYLVHHRIYLFMVPFLLNSNSNAIQIVLTGGYMIGLVMVSAKYLQIFSKSIDHFKNLFNA